MKHFVFIIIMLLIFQACSSTQPKNAWKYQANSSLLNYRSHYLQGNNLRAKADLAAARKHASQSAELYTLINIELSVCAMRLSTLESTSCKNAANLLLIDPDISQKAYLSLLQSQLNMSQISQLPRQYQGFAQALVEGDVKKLNNRIQDIDPLSSRLIASSIIQDQINDENIQELIQQLSYHGYKAPLLSWLKLQIQKEKNIKIKAKLQAKLQVLISH